MIKFKTCLCRLFPSGIHPKFAVKIMTGSRRFTIFFLMDKFSEKKNKLFIKTKTLINILGSTGSAYFGHSLIGVFGKPIWTKWHSLSRDIPISVSKSAWEIDAQFLNSTSFFILKTLDFSQNSPKCNSYDCFLSKPPESFNFVSMCKFSMMVRRLFIW